MGKENPTICGLTHNEIRKMYFKGKLKEMLAQIQEEQKWSVKEIKELGQHLEELRTEDEKLVQTVAEEFGGQIVEDEGKPPTVEELREGVSDEEWREKADKAIEYIDSKLTSIRKSIAEKAKIHPAFWLDTATIFLSMLEVIDKDRVFKDQLYRARMTEIIDLSGCSRKEAEERAKLTKEYGDYKNAVLLRERIDEFINLCKKKDAEKTM